MISASELPTRIAARQRRKRDQSGPLTSSERPKRAVRTMAWAKMMTWSKTRTMFCIPSATPSCSDVASVVTESSIETTANISSRHS